MKKSLVKTLTMSILTIVLASSLIVGGSFALFTSESKTNIAVTSGKVDISATVEDVEMTSSLGVALGSASVVGNEVSLQNFAPGDKATFKIALDNKSNIAVSYRTFVKVVEDDGLFDGLIVKIDAQAFNGFTAVSNWETASFTEDEIEISIELPEGRGNEYQGKTTKLAYTVEAVQGNLETEDVGVNEVHLYTAYDLIYFGKQVNTHAKNHKDKTVYLMNDIDMKNIKMDPIGSIRNASVEFAGTFDGQNHTIKNVNIVGFDDYGTGLFGSKSEQTTAVIKNFVMDGGSVIGSKNVGAVMGMAYKVTIENVTVKNMRVEQTGEKRASGIIANPIGVLAFVRNNKVQDSEIIGMADVSEIAANTATAILENNTHTNVSVSMKANFVVDTDAELLAALYYDAAYVNIILENDLQINVSNANIKFGTEKSKELVINGNGHLLTLSTTYWSRVNMQNEEAVLKFKDLDLTSTQLTGTWNSYDLYFVSKTSFEDVNFLKAVALANDSTMKNVTITESHDYYALWIVAAGHTVDIDGIVINVVNGRAIAIKEEYLKPEEVLSVNLTVKNAVISSLKKGAILVTSTAGANITLENVDIANAKADSVNHVWVDSDNPEAFDLVIVNSGITKYQEQ